MAYPQPAGHTQRGAKAAEVNVLFCVGQGLTGLIDRADRADSQRASLRPASLVGLVYLRPTLRPLPPHTNFLVPLLLFHPPLCRDSFLINQFAA